MTGSGSIIGLAPAALARMRGWLQQRCKGQHGMRGLPAAAVAAWLCICRCCAFRPLLAGAPAGACVQPGGRQTCCPNAHQSLSVLTICSSLAIAPPAADFGFDPLGLCDPEGAGGFITPEWLSYSEVRSFCVFVCCAHISCFIICCALQL